MGIYLILYIGIFLILILFLWLFLLQKKLSEIKRKQEVLFSGKKGKSLEDVVLGNKESVNQLKEDAERLYNITSQIHQHSLKSIHKVGLVRFNPFRDIGGDQSFSLALLDDKDSGAVISSLYSKEGVRIYAKSLQEGKTIKHPLTEEEKHAIAIASTEKTTKKV
ncbi:MAG: DUF4446 family protein [Patescibacteria group bacterium]